MSELPAHLKQDTVVRLSRIIEAYLTERGSECNVVQEGSGADLDPRILGARMDGVSLSISINVAP